MIRSECHRAAAHKVQVRTLTDVGARQKSEEIFCHRIDPIGADNVQGALARKLLPPRPVGISCGGIVDRIRRCHGAEVSIAKGIVRHCGRERSPLPPAQELVVPEYEHLVLPDGPPKAECALVLIERRGPRPFTAGPRIGDFLGERIGRKRGLVHVGPPHRTVYFVRPRLGHVLGDQSCRVAELGIVIAGGHLELRHRILVGYKHNLIAETASRVRDPVDHVLIGAEPHAVDGDGGGPARRFAFPDLQNVFDRARNDVEKLAQVVSGDGEGFDSLLVDISGDIRFLALQQRRGRGHRNLLAHRAQLESGIDPHRRVNLQSDVRLNETFESGKSFSNCKGEVIICGNGPGVKY